MPSAEYHSHKNRANTKRTHTHYFHSIVVDKKHAHSNEQTHVCVHTHIIQTKPNSSSRPHSPLSQMYVISIEKKKRIRRNVNISVCTLECEAHTLIEAMNWYNGKYFYFCVCIHTLEITFTSIEKPKIELLSQKFNDKTPIVISFHFSSNFNLLFSHFTFIISIGWLAEWLRMCALNKHNKFGRYDIIIFDFVCASNCFLSALSVRYMYTQYTCLHIYFYLHTHFDAIHTMSMNIKYYCLEPK